MINICLLLICILYYLSKLTRIIFLAQKYSVKFCLKFSQYLFTSMVGGGTIKLLFTVHKNIHELTPTHCLASFLSKFPNTPCSLSGFPDLHILFMLSGRSSPFLSTRLITINSLSLTSL